MNETKCFIFGLGAGVMAGLLMAPRSGAKTRKLIVEKAREGHNYVIRESTELRDAVVDTVGRTKRAAKAAAEGIGVALQVEKERLVG